MLLEPYCCLVNLFDRAKRPGCPSSGFWTLSITLYLFHIQAGPITSPLISLPFSSSSYTESGGHSHLSLSVSSLSLDATTIARSGRSLLCRRSTQINGSFGGRSTSTEIDIRVW
uniref:Uncharacterized protein n=1 Tax=Arundo donax TaxID=35708 RepID=A0A0A9BLE8_ARUDO